MIAGQRDLVAAACAGAMDCRNSRNLQCGKPVEDPLSFGNERTHVAGLRLFQQRLQVRAGDEDRFFRRRDDQPAQRSVVLDKIEVFIQLIESGGVENIRARFGTIERKQTNMIVADLTPNHRAG